MTRREKTALKHMMANDVLKYVRQHPRSTTKDIFLAMIKKNPYYAILVFSQKVDLVMSEATLGRVAASKTKADAKVLAEGGFGSPMTQRAMRRGLMGDLKRILHSQGEVVYGSGMFGQIHEKDMNEQDAAMWLAPRLSQMRNEQPSWKHSVDLLKRSGRARNDVAKVDRFTTLLRDPKAAAQAHEGVGIFFRRS